MTTTRYLIDGQNRPRNFFRHVSTTALALLISLTSTVFAQQVGSVAGQVVSKTTSKYLEGAEVNVSDTDLHTSTERDGHFLLRNVSIGSHKIVVNYPGMDTSELVIEVQAGKTAEIQVQLAAQEVKIISQISM